MDYSYTHDDATMVVFDLYSKMLEETGYSVDSPDIETEFFDKFKKGVFYDGND